MTRTSLDAIGQRNWQPEREERRESDFPCTDAEPGSPEKLQVLAQRIQQGLPLWHPNDRHAEDPPFLLVAESLSDEAQGDERLSA